MQCFFLTSFKSIIELYVVFFSPAQWHWSGLIKKLAFGNEIPQEAPLAYNLRFHRLTLVAWLSARLFTDLSCTTS